MRELKLKYFIELASNIGSKARTEAQALEQSQRAMQQAVDNQMGRVVFQRRALFGRFTGAGFERQGNIAEQLGRAVLGER